MCPRHPEAMYQVNYLGTWNVMEACRDTGVRRLVHTSSAVAIGEQHGTVGSEESPHRGRYLSAYERSKHLSEMLVLEARPGLEVVVVNPSSVQGPGRATGTGKLVLDVVRGKMPFLVDTTVSIVDIDDCARGHLLAAERGAPGRRYVLNGASLGIGAAIELIRRATGRQVGERYLPGPIATAGGRDRRARISHDRPTAPVVPGDGAGPETRPPLRRVPGEPRARAGIPAHRGNAAPHHRLVPVRGPSRSIPVASASPCPPCLLHSSRHGALLRCLPSTAHGPCRQEAGPSPSPALPTNWARCSWSWSPENGTRRT